MLGATLREETVRALENEIPASTSTASNPGKEPPTFVFMQSPDHWRMELGQHFCDEFHKSLVLLRIVTVLEQEGWRLRASHSVSNRITEKETTQMFLTRTGK